MFRLQVFLVLAYALFLAFLVEGRPEHAAARQLFALGLF